MSTWDGMMIIQRRHTT